MFPCVADAALTSLRKSLRLSRRAAYAAGTLQNLKTQLRSYFLFCLYFGFRPVPANSDVICLYAQFLARTITPASIRQYLNGVRILHLTCGVEFHVLEDFIVKITLKGIAKLALHTPKSALAITVPILLAVSRCVDHSAPSESVVFTAALFSFFLLARLSNIVPKSATPNSVKPFLCRKDILHIDDILVVVFHWTKTIQRSERKLSIPLVPIPGSPLCPVSAYLAMIQGTPALSTSPAFLHIVKGKLVPLTKGAFIKVFRELLCRANVPLYNSYTGHSFRRGGATWAFGAGLPGEVIQVIGDWHSDCYKRYFEFSLDTMLTVGQRVRDSILRFHMVFSWFGLFWRLEGFIEGVVM